MSTEKRLYRSRDNRMIGGVCAGLGEFVGIDPTMVRLGFVLGALFGVGSLIVVYLIMLLIVPEEPIETPAS
jgi:phage shock protein PspC (stress-responsive transcriptional regulator)